MPLGRNVGANIRELTEHGSRPRSHKQIVAIALHAAGKSKPPSKRGAKRRARAPKGRANLLGM